MATCAFEGCQGTPNVKCWECGKKFCREHTKKCERCKKWVLCTECCEPHLPWCKENLPAAEEAAEITFHLERDLQLALRANLEQLQVGLKVHDGGRECIVPCGRIDILAIDAMKTRVAIELKAGEADRDAVGQILSYIGDLLEDGKGQVRGILVAESFTARAIAAAKAAPNIELRKYSFKFTFSGVK